MFSSGVTMGLAEWIIDNTCHVLLSSNNFRLSGDPLKTSSLSQKNEGLNNAATLLTYCIRIAGK